MIEKKQIETPMRIDEASEFLGLAKSTIYSMVCRRSIPFCKRAGNGSLYFFRSELTEWIKEGASSSTRTRQVVDGLLSKENQA